MDFDSTAKGRWIPTTSVEQCAATLVSWYGLPAADLAYVFSNLRNFTITSPGFKQP